jgi:hypothetical protein
MILRRNAGLVTNNVYEISEQLSRWMLAKKAESQEFDLPDEVNHGLSRYEQFEKLDSLLINNNLMKNIK